MEGGAVRIMSGKFCPPTYKVDLPFLLSASSLRRFDGPTEPDIMGIRLGLDIVCIFTFATHAGWHTTHAPQKPTCPRRIENFARVRRNEHTLVVLTLTSFPCNTVCM